MRKAARLNAWLLLLGGMLASARLAAQQPSDTLDKPITPGSESGDLGETDRYPLQLTGFGVAGYDYSGRTGENSFAAGKLALGIFREITSHAYVFGQLTTAVSQDPAGGDPITETEIDNLLVSVVPPGASNLNLTLGKLDLPIGFERDDEPLLFLASPSFNFALGRPVKMVGLSGTWTPGPKTEVSAFLFNGWDTELDPNQGKSGGVRLGLLPQENLSLGLSGLYGVEGDPGATNDRYLLTLDYAWQPSWNWVVAGEASYGGDRGVLAGKDATWGGGMLTLSHQFTRHWGFAARAEVFRDGDGARTGLSQTLESYSLTPLWSLGVGREGIFANLPHTRVRIPRLQARAEIRVNHSTEPYFDTSGGLDTWNVEYRLQLVTTF
jgi:putative OmpL-like beta-barrel porin-2